MLKNKTQFVEFLIKAKQKTYAGGGEPSAPSRPASHDLQYAEGDYLYIDTYLGSFDFIGEEAVWQAGEPVWSMNYYGWMLVEEVPDGFSPCLKNALLNAPFEAPFRGPAVFQHGKFTYSCTWQGDLQRFEGREKIALEGRTIYELVFHGGMLR